MHTFGYFINLFEIHSDLCGMMHLISPITFEAFFLCMQRQWMGRPGSWTLPAHHPIQETPSIHFHRSQSSRDTHESKAIISRQAYPELGTPRRYGSLQRLTVGRASSLAVGQRLRPLVICSRRSQFAGSQIGDRSSQFGARFCAVHIAPVLGVVGKNKYIYRFRK